MTLTLMAGNGAPAIGTLSPVGRMEKEQALKTHIPTCVHVPICEALHCVP